MEFLLQVVACWFLALLYHWPLNAYLMRESRKSFVFSASWSFLFAVVSWFSYRLLQGAGLNESLVVLLMWAVPQALHAAYFGLGFFGIGSKQRVSIVDAGKELGFVLFSPLCTVCVVISVPLVVAILRHLLASA